MDYYLVPGAEWSLVKKGEVVQIIGQARDTGWYRCMALRDSKVKLDNAPFSFLSKSLASSNKSKRQSGITPEMIEEDYAKNKSPSTYSLAEVCIYVWPSNSSHSSCTLYSNGYITSY